ncbi:serine hydrolase domain-containing protein [Specibacter cremeus]|uniref:serine hydrolase domain-containing protein n=1 Tax=Specibacter cremeus TaxID=1629051 RepID=UPI000F7931E7|nr:serine hydrolase domain-containing protein [Specibacter cremeus]
MSPARPGAGYRPGTRDPLVRAVQAVLDAAVGDGVAPSATCAIAVNGDALPVLHAGDGTPGTFYDLASVTKLFSTVTALALVDAGRLTLDEPVARWLPEYAQGAKAAVTLRHLLTHTSGLPSEWRGWHRALSEGLPFDRDALVTDLLATALEAAPGTRFAYSCAGFNTVMALTERVTGEPWARLVTDLVLEPLGLEDAVRGNPPAHLCAPTEFQPELGRGVVRGIVHDEAAWSLGGVSGNAGLFATAPGLRRFGEALRAGLGGVLSPALAADMWRSQLPEVLGGHFDPAAPGFGHGLGLRINQQPWMGVQGTLARGHGGFTGTSLLVDRHAGITIALLTNRIHPRRDGNDATELRRAVSDVVRAGATTGRCAPDP